jgi:Cu/Ag efflux pump CusA
VKVLLPKEHGAYGQIAFPLATAFAVAGVSAAGLFLCITAVAGFLAHEPAATHTAVIVVATL